MLRLNLQDQKDVKYVLESCIHLTYEVLEEIVTLYPALLNQTPTLIN